LYQSLEKINTVPSLPESTKNKISQFVKMMADFRKDISGPVEPLVERVFTDSGLEKMLISEGTEGKDALENAGELISAAAVFDKQTENPTLIDYLQQIALFSDADAYDAASERVAMMTLHSAKGLEFDNVFIVGVEEGLLPHERSADDDNETEEERRLFFVGITRAKTNLKMTFARYRQIRGQTLRTIPSQFLFELGLNFSESTRSVVPESCFPGQEQGTQSEIENILPNSQYSVPNALYRRGDIVVHKKFGIGTVKDYADMGDNSVVTVAFNTGQTKTLMTKYAPLVKL
jgi:DNA helicase-2/ATP-dependent DNA helicase PcrA